MPNDTNGAVVESVPVGSYHLRGFRGALQTRLTLHVRGRWIEGYVTRVGSDGETIPLRGTLDEGGLASLHEASAVSEDTHATTGRWTLSLQPGRPVTGEYADQQLSEPVVLHHDPDFARFPFRLNVIVHSQRGMAHFRQPNKPVAGSPKQATVSELQVYRDSKLVQTITGFRSTSLGKLIWPQIEDVNFDGWADIRLRRINASGQTALYYWQYDPRSGTFQRSHALDELTGGWDTLAVDPINRFIIRTWESSGSTGYGAVYYRWEDDHPIIWMSRSCYPMEHAVGKFACRTNLHGHARP